MIRFFSEPRPDETMYSISVRHSEKVGNDSIRVINKELLCKIDYFADNYFSRDISVEA